MREFGLGQPHTSSGSSALRLEHMTVSTRLYARVRLFSAPITQGIDQQGEGWCVLPTGWIVQVIA